MRRQAEAENRDWHAVAMGAEAQLIQREEELRAAARRAEVAEARAWELERQGAQVCG